MFLFHGLFFELNLHIEIKTQIDCLNLFSGDASSLESTLCCCCCCSLQSDLTPRRIQQQAFKRKQLMNEHDLNMQMQLKFRSFPPNAVFNLLFIFALDGTHTLTHAATKPCLSPFQVACTVFLFLCLAVITFQGNVHFIHYPNNIDDWDGKAKKKTIRKKMIKQRFSVVHCTGECFGRLQWRRRDAMCQC